MIVRCTARLLKLLAPGQVADVPPAPDDWYANLLWIDRRMTDMASMSEHLAGRAGGVTCLDVEELNAFLRRTPYKRDGYGRPIDAARQR